MHKIELIVFDMAGTTINEDNIVYKTLQKTISDCGYKVSLATVLEIGAGKEKFNAIKDIIFNLVDINKIELLTEIIFEKFKKELEMTYALAKVSVFDGVEELFNELRKKGIKIALNTGYDFRTATSLLEKIDWKRGVNYDVLITATDVEKNRPNPDMILKAMSILDIKSALAVMKVGDSSIDILEGKNANCGVTIGVTTGAHTRSQLEEADPTYVIESILKIQEIID